MLGRIMLAHISISTFLVLIDIAYGSYVICAGADAGDKTAVWLRW